jgi:hypothetical protein
MRKDIHKPSAIEPADYEYVAEEFLKIECLGDAICLKAQRDIIAAHRAQTGGRYAQVDTTGNCMVCGSVNAIYTSLFYHAKSNTYVRMGHDCADKVEMGDSLARNRFRAAVEDARERYAGKQKAIALLGDWGLSEAWTVYISDLSEYPTGRLPFEVVTIRDIVGKLVQYGSTSEKQQNFVRNLLYKIANRPVLEAKREAEKALAADCPEGRIEITGEILTVREDATDFGMVTKILVKHTTGYKVWGSMSSSLRTAEAVRGNIVSFTATVTKSKDDRTFGFFKRPTGGTKICEEKTQ